MIHVIHYDLSFGEEFSISFTSSNPPFNKHVQQLFTIKISHLIPKSEQGKLRRVLIMWEGPIAPSVLQFYVMTSV